IPALVGIPLPTGEVHDGFGFAHDTGRGITGNRVDIFVGFESDRDNALTRSGRIESQERTSVYTVDGATTRAINARFAKEFTWHEGAAVASERRGYRRPGPTGAGDVHRPFGRRSLRVARAHRVPRRSRLVREPGAGRLQAARRLRPWGLPHTRR